MGHGLKLLWRALRWRCPACGRGALFVHWLKMRPSCPACGLWLEREEGHFLGAMLLNLVVAELLCAAGVLALLVYTWPNPPWGALQWGAPAAAVLVPIALYPFSKACWLALDLLVQPARAEERAAPPGLDEAPPPRPR